MNSEKLVIKSSCHEDPVDSQHILDNCGQLNFGSQFAVAVLRNIHRTDSKNLQFYLRFLEFEVFLEPLTPPSEPKFDQPKLPALC